jgi:hypothetical protein
VELAPRQDIYALITRSQLALRAGQKGQATTFLEQVVSAKSPHYLWHAYGNLLVETGSYAKAAQAFLEGWAWLDAAWVAEHFLSTEELQKLVPRLKVHTPEPDFIENMPSDPQEAMAHLLARRLAREDRWSEAIKWYPPSIQGEAQKALDLNRKITASTGRDRAAARFALAQLLRHFGMELLGTEAGPDFYIFGGDYAYGDISSGLLTKPSLSAETRFKILSNLGPVQRFHYRYTAAELAWKAAAELPDEDPLLIQALCVGGSWLKHRDPLAAERFYHALVNRGRPDPIARVADGRRWFPESDGYSCKALPWPPPIPYSYPPSNLQMARLMLEEEKEARQIEQQHRWLGRGVSFVLGALAAVIMPVLWKQKLQHQLERVKWVVLVILLGLLSRMDTPWLPGFIREHVGDALYATMMVLLWGGFTSRPVLAGLLSCYLIELSQLVHTPVLDALRETLPGRLVLGQGFVWEDLVRYTMGAGIGWGLERKLVDSSR